MTPDLLVLVLPIFELGPRASEDDPLAGDAPRADLAGVEVLDDVRRDQRGEHEDADGRVRVVADLVRALLAARERDDVALAQLLLTLVRAQRRLAAEDDRRLFRVTPGIFARSTGFDPSSGPPAFRTSGRRHND